MFSYFLTDKVMMHIRYLESCEDSNGVSIFTIRCYDNFSKVQVKSNGLQPGPT